MTNQKLAFGRVLREVRLDRGLSQEALGFEAGRDRTYISMLELGQCSPTLDTILTLCEALNISFSDLAARIDRQLAAPDD